MTEIPGDHDTSIARRSLADFLFPLTISVLLAAIAAVVGFVAGVGLCDKLFSGEASESGLIVAPVLALFCGLATFLIAFWKLT